MTQLSVAGLAGAQALAQALSANTTVTSLCVARCSLGADACAQLCSGLAQRGMPLRDFDLSQNSAISHGHGAQAARGIWSVLATCPYLQTLTLSSCGMSGPAAWAAIGKGMEANATLTSLSIDGGSLCCDGAEALGLALASCQTLRNLELDGIAPEAWPALSGGIARCPCLAELRLGFFTLDEPGARSLGRGLRMSGELAYVRLRGFQTAAPAWFLLLSSLEGGGSICDLDLRGNSLGDLGAQGVAEFVKEGSVRCLRLCNCNIGPDGCGQLGAALAASSSLQTLHLSGNSIGEEGARHLEAALSANSTLSSLHLVGW